MARASGNVGVLTPSPPGATPTLGAVRALVGRALRDVRVRTIVFAYVFAAYAYIQPVGYGHTYTTRASRLAFAHGFANNLGLRLFYGLPHDVSTINGYSAWRVGGTLAIAAIVFGLLAAVRALRTEEDAGRLELVLAGMVDRRTVFGSVMTAIAFAVATLWIAEFAGFVVGGLPVGGSAYLALATISVVPVGVGVGAIASQLAPTRRVALQLGGAIVGLMFLMRVVADTASGAGWLRWITPLGWAEELRPFAGPRPVVLLLPAVATLLLLMMSARIASRRDIGTGLLRTKDGSRPRLGLLSSSTAQALRSEWGSLIAWTSGVAVFGFVLGVVSQSVSSAGLSTSVQREIAKLGSGSILTPTGYVAFVFIFFVLAVSLFTCAQIGAARHEEADERLETLFALPVSRIRWLGGRIALASSAAAVISVAAGLFTWAGAAAVGVHVSLPRLIEAGANCLPAALLFLGIAALSYAVAPRASGEIAYGLVTVTFLWQLGGSLLGAPRWVVDLTPFAHVGLVPAQPFRAGPAAVMLAVGVAAGLAAIRVFRHRDLSGA